MSNWFNVSELGKSQVVKSMAIWMIVTPFIAKALSSTNSFTLSFIKTDSPILLSLPFSWQVFFFSAVFFTIANIIYTWKCPPLIKKYKNYAEFKDTDNSMYMVINDLREHISDKVVYDNFLELGVIVSKYTPSEKVTLEWTSDDTSNVNWKKGIDSLSHAEKENHPDIFSSLRIFLSKLYPFWSTTCLTLYFFGFLCLGLVLVENIMYVIEHVKFY